MTQFYLCSISSINYNIKYVIVWCIVVSYPVHFFSLAPCVQNKEFPVINNVIIVEKKWCDDVDLNTGYQSMNFYLSVQMTERKKTVNK